MLGGSGRDPSPTWDEGCSGLQAGPIKRVIALLQRAHVQLVPLAKQLEPARPLLWFAVGTQDDAHPQGPWGGRGASVGMEEAQHSCQQEQHTLMECLLCAGHWSLLNSHLGPLAIHPLFTLWLREVKSLAQSHTAGKTEVRTQTLAARLLLQFFSL